MERTCKSRRASQEKNCWQIKSLWACVPMSWVAEKAPSLSSLTFLDASVQQEWGSGCGRPLSGWCGWWSSYTRGVMKPALCVKVTSTRKERWVIVVGDSPLRGTEGPTCQTDTAFQELCCLSGLRTSLGNFLAWSKYYLGVLPIVSLPYGW